MYLPYHSPYPQLPIKHCISQSYENLLLRQEAMNQARAGWVTKKLAKLTPVQDFQECCNRYTATTHCSVDFMDLVCHIDSMVMFCVFRFGVHVRVVCAFVWSLVWFFLFVCFMGGDASLDLSHHISWSTPGENSRTFQTEAYMLHLHTPKSRCPSFTFVFEELISQFLVKGFKEHIIFSLSPRLPLWRHVSRKGFALKTGLFPICQ